MNFVEIYFASHVGYCRLSRSETKQIQAVRQYSDNHLKTRFRPPSHTVLYVTCNRDNVRRNDGKTETNSIIQERTPVWQSNLFCLFIVSSNSLHVKASMLSIAERGENYLSRNVQTGSGAHLTSYSEGTGTALLEGKVAGTWSSPLNFSRLRMGGAITLLFHTPS